MKTIEIPAIDNNAMLFFAESRKHIPFDIKRVFFIRDIAQGSRRGKHANKKLKEVIFCIQGSMTISLQTKTHAKMITLNDPSKGLFIDKMTWVDMSQFSKDAIILVLASQKYDPTDQIWDYKEFLKLNK